MTSRLRIVAITLLAAGGFGIAALHGLRPELDPAGHRLSEYANGPYGYVMTAVFVSIGAALVSLALALKGTHDGWRWTHFVTAAVASAGIAMVMSGIYRTDPGGAGTTAETIHSRASAFATLALIASAITWSLLRPAPPPRRQRAPAPFLAVTASLLGAVSPALHRSAWTGLSQRLLWLTLLAWLIVMAWGLPPTRRPALR